MIKYIYHRPLGQVETSSHCSCENYKMWNPNSSEPMQIFLSLLHGIVPYIVKKNNVWQTDARWFTMGENH